MAASLDGQQAAPLTRTLTRDSSNPSDFLLLTTARASTLPSYALPRPRYLPVLVAAALLDFAWTALYAVPLAWEAKTGLWVAVAVSWLRSVLVLAVVTSVRVRERSAWILAQLMVILHPARCSGITHAKRLPLHAALSPPPTNS